MRAVQVERHGDPDVLRLVAMPKPEPGPGDVLVRLRASGVCGHDVLARAGRIPLPLPQVLGHEGAGEVVAAGPEVVGLAVGDRVALTPMLPCGRCEPCLAGRARTCRVRGGLYGEEIPGTYGEYVVANELSAVRLPDIIDFIRGSILGCAVASAVRAVNRGRVALGETVVVTGASGGVGIHLVQVARAVGARVIAVTGSAANVAALLEAGAHEVLAGDQPFESEVRRLTGGSGADVVLDSVGPPLFKSCLASLRTMGRLVAVGNVQPRDVPANLGQVIMREFELIGTARPGRVELQESIRLVANGSVKPWVGRTFQLDQAASAHRLMEERGVVGRLVLEVE